MNETIKNVSNILEKEKDVLALFLFGSRAREESKKDSDYDFYLILDRNTKDSLREDQLIEKVIKAAKNAEIHLTFQYLFVVDEDKSLILKISSEGKLLFSKTYLITPYQQFGLQKYFICKWEVDEKKYAGGNKKEYIKNTKLLISRFLYGYEQKYKYKNEEKISKKQGIVDNKTVFGENGMIIIPEIIFNHVKYFLEKNRAKITQLKIVNSCYIPKDNLKHLEKFYLKKELEKIMQEETKKDLFITAIAPFDDALSIKFELKGEEQRRNTIKKIKELPKEIQKTSILRKKYEFT